MKINRTGCFAIVYIECQRVIKECHYSPYSMRIQRLASVSETKCIRCATPAAARRNVWFSGADHTQTVASMSSNRRKTRAAITLPQPMHVVNDTPIPIISHDHRHELLVRYFAHHDRPADTPEQRAVALGVWLDAAVAAVPELHPDNVFIAATTDTPTTRRKTVRIVAAVPDAGRVMRLIDVLRPSGRFDALVDMGNPMKGINLFPYLRRHVEGRALRAVGPAASLELSRTVSEAVLPRRWPRQVLLPLISAWNNVCLHRVDVDLHLPATPFPFCFASFAVSSSFTFFTATLTISSAISSSSVISFPVSFILA
jgi:hypothetical protein